MARTKSKTTTTETKKTKTTTKKATKVKKTQTKIAVKAKRTKTKKDKNKIIEINETEIKEDQQKTSDQLIIDNQKFAYSVVNKEFKKYLNFTNIKEDLYSAAKMGLVIAARKYNHGYENKFISYAVHWIRYYVNEEIRKHYPVKLNQNHVYKRNRLLKAIAKYKKENNGKEPSDAWLMKELNISQKVLDGIRKVNGGKNFKFVYLQNTLDTEDGEMSNENKVYAEIEKTTNPQAAIEAEDILNTLKTMVSDRDYNIFIDIKKYGYSFKDIKDKYNLKFASSAAYLVKRMEKMCREIGYA